jgi:hypothetical protein
MKKNTLTVIAGPCSIDENNIKEIYQIADITVNNMDGNKQRAIAGTRVVGIKSRTELSDSGDGMGIDYPIFKKNTEMLVKGGCIEKLKIPPSVKMAEKIHKDTNMIIATEIMSPLVQLPNYVGRIPKGKLMPWNPAVEQLGWPIALMSDFCRKNGWHVGIKNGKWVGDHIHNANTQDYEGQTTMEKTWSGLTKYVGKISGDIVLIHRGVDVPDKGQYRNTPVHNLAQRVKKATGAKLFFDPSHAFGPKMRQHITYAVIDAMKIMSGKNEYLYDGILIETGTSKTDTEQHITVNELKILVEQIATFRDLVSPEA